MEAVMQLSAIPMMRLRRSSSPGCSADRVVQSDSRWYRSRKGILIASAVITLIIAITAVIIALRKAPSGETSTAIPTSAWLPWSQRFNDSRVPRILLWDPAGAPPALERAASQPVTHLRSSRALHCILGSGKELACEVTMQHRRVQESDALVFYGENITASLLPDFRNPGQMWVFWATTQFPPPLSHDDLLQIEGLFNWTMGRRDDADVTVSYQTWRCGRSGRFDLNRGKQNANTQKWKYRKDAAWIVGHCERKTFIKVSHSFMAHSVESHETKGAIRVHSFPACGISHCGSRRECVRYIAQNYHFIIVSDIPECFQSASDLIYEAFEYNVVPVVLEAKPSLALPRKSVISSSTMRHPGELAAYLRTLIDNPKLYNQYFAWKDKCAVAPGTVDGLCFLCGALHEKPLRGRRHDSVLDWWKQPRNCSHSLSPHSEGIVLSD
ncbi:hypothetical protein MTO96_011366 [Rhipicephalus appendiculatus]